MPSPFPGMNPYLEQDDAWHDFHERFIPLVATLLGGQLRPRYIVKIDEHVYVHELAAEIAPLGREGRHLSGTWCPRSRARDWPRSGHGTFGGTGASPAPRRGPRAPEFRGNPRSKEPRVDHGRRALEPGEQVRGPRSRAIPGQAHGAPQRPGPSRRDRPAARGTTFAGGRPARLLLFGPGQPGREPSRRRFLADRAPRAAARSSRSRSVRPTRMLSSICKQSWTASTMMRAMRTTFIEGTPSPRLKAEDMEWARQFLPGPNAVE